MTPFFHVTYAAMLIAACMSIGAMPVLEAENVDMLHRWHSAVVAFGDSFSDNGNGAWVISNHTWPADPHYAGGRFSNGPVWVEYLAGNLSVPLIDYAVGGATSSNGIVQGFTGPGSTIPVPSVDEQVASFLEDPPLNTNVSLSDPLFVFFGGANDPFFNPNVTASQTFHSLIGNKPRLAARYPEAQFVFLNYPDLSRIPVAFYLDPSSKRALRQFSKELGALYRDADREGHNDFTYVDLVPLFADFDYYGSPTAYGFAPLGEYGSCLTGAYGETDFVTLCDDADMMVFWDEYHPTTHAHSWVTQIVLEKLKRL